MPVWCTSPPDTVQENCINCNADFKERKSQAVLNDICRKVDEMKLNIQNWILKMYLHNVTSDKLKLSVKGLSNDFENLKSWKSNICQIQCNIEEKGDSNEEICYWIDLLLKHIGALCTVVDFLKVHISTNNAFQCRPKVVCGNIAKEIKGAIDKLTNHDQWLAISADSLKVACTCTAEIKNICLIAGELCSKRLLALKKKLGV